MRSLRAFATAFLALLSALAGAKPIAFVDVTVISVDDGKLSPVQTVLIRDGRIVAVGPAGSIAIQERREESMAATAIFPRPGRYARPLRAPQFPGKQIEWGTLDYREKNTLYAFLYVANSVTTNVRNLWGAPQTDQLATDIKAGRLPGPTVSFDRTDHERRSPAWKEARTVTNAAEAEAAVHADKASGYVGHQGL